MNSSNTIRALFAVSFAASATLASAQLTPADVNGQRSAALARGQLGALLGEDSGSVYVTSHFHSIQSRDEVKRDLQEKIKAGTLTVLIRGDSGSVYLSRHQVLRTPRQEVRAALEIAEKDGTLDQLHGEDSGSFALSHQRRVDHMRASNL